MNLLEIRIMNTNHRPFPRTLGSGPDEDDRSIASPGEKAISEKERHLSARSE
jgi:hypothetical protein